MGQKASLLSHQEKHAHRGGSFHISSQASRRREAFKSAKKSHFSFGDEPSRHSIHQKQSTSNSRRLKNVIDRTQETASNKSNPKPLSTPEREYRMMTSGTINMSESLVHNRNSTNVDYFNHLNPDYISDFVMKNSGSNRSQSPADSINRSLYGTTCSHHSSVKLSEDEDANELSTPNNCCKAIVNVKETFLSPPHSPLGYKTNMNEFSQLNSKPHNKQSTKSIISTSSKTSSNDAYKKPVRPVVHDNNLDNINFQRKHQTMPLTDSKSELSSNHSGLSQENLVAALLPPSPLSQKERRAVASSNPHKLSPYNLSPRSLSPAQSAANKIGNTNTKSKPNNQWYKDNKDHASNNRASTSQLGPNILINSEYTPIDTTKPSGSNIKRKVPLNSGEESLSLLGLGGDLLSINSKSDTSLSSISFLKTPSIGLSPTAARENYFFAQDMDKSDDKINYQSSSGMTKITNNNKRKDLLRNVIVSQQSIEKSASMEGIKSRSPQRDIEDKKRVQSRRDKEPDQPTTKPQRPVLTRGISLLTQLLWPRSVPEELNSQICPEFQGHQLLSWFCHWCSPHLKTAHKSELYLLGCQVCTCLIACQQLIPCRRKRSLYNIDSNSGTNSPNNSSSSQNNIFQPEQMYHWNNQRETVKEEEKKALYNRGCSYCQNMKEDIHQKELQYSYDLQRMKHEQELEVFKVKNEGVMKICQLNDKVEQLERQVEKYRILAGIEGLARQMWHEEAVAANSNLVMSKSPTLQSIGTASNSGIAGNIRSAASSMKSCSTDTSDLDEGVNTTLSVSTNTTVTINNKINNQILEDPDRLMANQLANVHSISKNQEKTLILTNTTNKETIANATKESILSTTTYSTDEIGSCSNTQSYEYVHSESQKVAKINIKTQLHRSTSISNSGSIPDDKVSANDKDYKESLPPHLLSQLINTATVNSDTVKSWLDLHVNLDNIDFQILQTILEMIPHYSDVGKKTGYIQKESAKSLGLTGKSDMEASALETTFWSEVNIIPHLEEKIHFLTLYREHTDLAGTLDSELQHFNYVSHFLKHSDSLLRLLSIVMETSTDLHYSGSSSTMSSGSGIFDLALSLDRLLQLKRVHPNESTSLAGGFLNHIIERYIEDTTQHQSQGKTSQTSVFPLPEPADLAQLCQSQMTFTNMNRHLDKLDDSVRTMTHISRCIMSCSRQSFLSSDICAYSTTIVQLIKTAENECTLLRDQFHQCENQFSDLQNFFSTNMDSQSFFTMWLEFSQEFKQIWIKKFMNISHKSSKDGLDKISVLPISPITTQLPLAAGSTCSTTPTNPSVNMLKPIGTVIPRRPNYDVTPVTKSHWSN